MKRNEKLQVTILKPVRSTAQHSRAGLDDMERRKSSPLPELELQPLNRPACSQSLY
jgi:hypothetical protein